MPWLHSHKDYYKIIICITDYYNNLVIKGSLYIAALNDQSETKVISKCSDTISKGQSLICPGNISSWWTELVASRFLGAIQSAGYYLSSRHVAWGLIINFSCAFWLSVQRAMACSASDVIWWDPKSMTSLCSTFWEGILPETLGHSPVSFKWALKT